MLFELGPDITRIYYDSGDVIDVMSDIAAKAYFSGGSIDLGLLPPAVRWLSADGLGVILERPPQQLTISYRETLYTICVPWTIWGIRLNTNRTVDKSFLFARPFPLASLEDELYAFPLPNMANNSAIALPSVRKGHLGQALMEMVETYWNRPFSGAFNEMLTDKEMVPDEWIPSLEEDVEKYLVFLGEHNLESITFAPLKVAQLPTLDALCFKLDPTLQEEGPQTALGFLENIVKRGRQMAGY